MLTSLRVKNLALVEDTRVTFGAGLNVITGETGAGKSILIGALGLLLGERADKSLIRAGAETCSIEAVFTCPDPLPLNRTLDELGLEPLEEQQLIIRRVIRNTGSGQAWINDQPVTVQALKSVGEQLVDMHGPYDHQSLLRTDEQRNILDAFGQCGQDRAAYEAQYDHLRAIERRVAELPVAGDQIDGQIELLAYQVKELEEANLSETEETEVGEEHAVFGHAQQIVELANTAAGALTETDGSAADTLATVLRTFDELSRLLPDAAAWRVEIDEASLRIREVSGALAERMEAIDADPARLDWLDQRLTTYQKMKRKYGPTVRDALERLATVRQRLEDLQQVDEKRAALDRERAALMEILVRDGRVLSKRRRAAGDKLAKAITAELTALGFAHGRFAVELQSGEPQASGLDEIEFLFEPNVGEGMRPLRQIASSGEISRVMLATKAVLARHDRIPVLVFDEIDANIGGETGGAVGRKLAEVARHHQILCITHLPQVAMYGQTQYAVRKQVADGRTRTDVVALPEEERVEEIARMLGGRTLTELTLRHAREMLKAAVS